MMRGEEVAPIEVSRPTQRRRSWFRRAAERPGDPLEQIEPWPTMASLPTDLHPMPVANDAPEAPVR